MSYADGLLASGERVTLRSRQHPLAVVLEARLGILAVLGAIALLILGGSLDPTGVAGTLRQLVGWLTLIIFVAGAGQIGLAVANWYTEEYIVTNRRVMKVDGLLNKHSADSALEKINDAVLDQNVFGRIFNFGDLDIITAAEETVDHYAMLRDVIGFKKEILNQKRDLEMESVRPAVTPPLRAEGALARSTVSETAVPAGPAVSTSGGTAPTAGQGSSAAASAAPQGRTMTPAEVTQTLAGLADLRDRGAITPQEFEAKKADLLGRL